MNEIILAIIQPIFLLLLAPLVSGTTRVLRAKMHTRQGPSILQDYYDIAKLFKRQDIHTENSGFVFRIMPVVFLASVLLLAMGIPMVTRFCPIPLLGDIITIIYLLVLPRFFFALSSIDSSGSYPGVGGIRELLLGVLVEPSMLLALFVAALAAGSTNIGVIGDSVALFATTSPVAVVIAAVAFAAAGYIELGKLPYDLAEAEQEIQEGPLAEYSGPSLALLKLAMPIKQILIVSLFLSIFFPFGSAVDMALPSLAIGLVLYWIKISVVFLVCAVIENSVMRVRFKLLSRQTWMVVGLAVLSFAFFVIGV
ncbi:MAG: NADH-quinone oxidoreductase subunit H [Raoultibacter sp.]